MPFNLSINDYKPTILKKLDKSLVQKQHQVMVLVYGFIMKNINCLLL